MINSLIVQKSNSSLRTKHRGMVAVFFGGTSGIGQATCREFVRNTLQPTVYVIGRDQSRGSKLVKELQALNSDATVSFVSRDLTVLRNVDEVCQAILKKESKINLLFMTTNFFSLNGREETMEGLDKALNLQYYSRMLLVERLLPLLASASQISELARVISVLGAGREGHIFEDDLLLRETYSLKNCARQAICMTSLSFEKLASSNPAVSFVHISPGIVRGTNIATGMGPLINTASRFLLLTLMRPLTISLQECAAIQLYVATGSLGENGDEKTNGHVFRLEWNGNACPENKVLTECMRQGKTEDIWRHTMEVFQNVIKA